MSDNGMYATPKLEPVEQSKGADGEPVYLMSTPDVMAYGEHAKAWVDMMAEALDTVDKQAAAHDGNDDGEGGGTIDADEFADD